MKNIFKKRRKEVKYKVGDKVKMRSLEGMADMCKDRDRISSTHIYMDEEIKKLFPDRILTVREVQSRYEYPCYSLEGIGWGWTNNEIECLVSEYIEPEPISSRFEILDL